MVTQPGPVLLLAVQHWSQYGQSYLIFCIGEMLVPDRQPSGLGFQAEKQEAEEVFSCYLTMNLSDKVLLENLPLKERV